MEHPNKRTCQSGNVFLLLIYLAFVIDQTEQTPLNAKSAVDELIAHKGYPLEKHSVVTEDGYILGLHRIPHGISNTTQARRPAVFLMHGLLGSTENWIVMGPQYSLGFMLADDGYDVWFGNARGNTYSRRHKHLNPDWDIDFWQFSFHEIGVYDLPAMIDYVIEKTGQERIFYVGHSQGGTTFLVMSSERPEFNKKIKLGVSLAPGVFLHGVVDIIFRAVAILDRRATKLLQNLKGFEVLQNNGLLRLLKWLVCMQNAQIGRLCGELAFTIVGGDVYHINSTIIPDLLNTLPAGVSTRQYLHYGQTINADSFQQYDHGPAVNMMKYGSRSPPEYHLERVTAPTVTFYSEDDQILPYKGIERMIYQLPNVVYSHLISNLSFTHFDFIFSQAAKEEIYKEILKFFKRY